MSKNQRVSGAALMALREALIHVYWYKKDLHQFLRHSVQDKAILAGIDFYGPRKRESIDELLDRLDEDQGSHLGTIRALMRDVSKMKDFSHLKRQDDGPEKAEKARTAVANLRQFIETHDKATKTKESVVSRRKREDELLSKRTNFKGDLEALNVRYMDVLTPMDPKARGFALERFMRDLFDLFDLDPKSSFKIEGEQIDGAFTLDGTHFLFEAKWQKDPVAAADLYTFDAKVKRKLENTLGLFLSINGFSDEGLAALANARPHIILATGAELMTVLEQRIGFRELLAHKKRHAAQTGRILFNPLKR